MCVVICLWSQKTRKVRLNTPIYAPNFLVVCIDLLIPSRAVRGSGMLFIGLFSICEGRRFQIGMKKVAVLHFLTIPNTANIWDSSLFSFNHRLSVCRFDSNFRCQFSGLVSLKWWFKAFDSLDCEAESHTLMCHIESHGVAFGLDKVTAMHWWPDFDAVCHHHIDG